MGKKYSTNHAGGMTAGPGNTQAAANRATTGASARVNTMAAGPSKGGARTGRKSASKSSGFAQGGKSEGISAGHTRMRGGKNNLTSGFQGFKG